MFTKNKKGSRISGRKSVPSIVSQDMNVLGSLITDGVVDISGKIEGNVRAGRVIIRENGTIKGDIIADEIHIYGTVEGLVKVKDVHLFSTSHVQGNIMHELLSVEDGANVDGQFKRTSHTQLQIEQIKTEGQSEPEDSQEEDVKLLENIRLITSQ